MILIACVDDNLGMMFNKRRQSRDIKVIEHIRELIKENTLWINPYSKELFVSEERLPENVLATEQSTERAQNGEYCFLENEEIAESTENVEKIILYFWNRNYPSDKKFPVDLEEWEQISEEEFEGNSHDLITQKIYIRRNEECQKEDTQAKRKLKNKAYPISRHLLLL